MSDSISDGSENTNEEIDDGNNGVVCWFYVYKNDTESNTPFICGIVIIKRLTDQSEIYFYAQTKRTENKTSDNKSDENYDNDELIKKFINTKPDRTIVNDFFRSSDNNKKWHSGDCTYETLFELFEWLIDKNFVISRDSDDIYSESHDESFTNR